MKEVIKGDFIFFKESRAFTNRGDGMNDLEQALNNYYTAFAKHEALKNQIKKPKLQVLNFFKKGKSFKKNDFIKFVENECGFCSEDAKNFWNSLMYFYRKSNDGYVKENLQLFFDKGTKNWIVLECANAKICKFF